MQAETARGVRRCGCRNCRHIAARERLLDRELADFRRQLEQTDCLSDLALYEPGGLEAVSLVERIDAYFKMPAVAPEQ